MIRLYDLNRRLADIEMIDGRMRIVSYAPDVATPGAANIRRSWSHKRELLTDQEFYDLLPQRLRSQIRAVRI